MRRITKLVLCLFAINVAALAVAHAPVISPDKLPPVVEAERDHTAEHAGHHQKEADFCDMAVGHCGAYTVPHGSPAGTARYSEVLSTLFLNERIRSKFHPERELRPPRV